MFNGVLAKIFGGNAVSSIDKIGVFFAGKTPVWLLCLAGAALVSLVIYVYRKEIKSAPVSIKTLLASLRILALLLLLLMFLEPVLVIDRVSFLKPYAAVLTDDSLSMGISDYGRPRIEAANGVLENDASGILKRLEQKCRLKLYRFSRQASLIEREEKKKTIVAVDRNGYTTSLGMAVRKALEDLNGQPVAGIVVITDGGNNSGEDPLDAAAAAAEQGIPVYCVGTGDPKEKKDLIISNVFADEAAGKDDIVNLSVTVEARGFKGVRIPVRLMKKGRLVKEAEVYLEDGNFKKEINMNFTADEAGEFDYTVLTPPLPGEISELNNKKTVRIKITDDKIKVLYLERFPRWEYRYLVRSLKRDKNVILSGLLENADAGFSEGSRPLASFPDSREQLYDFDVVILGDISKNYLNKSALAMIRDFVQERGGSLLFMPGTAWSGYSERVQEIENMLPVELGSGSSPSGKVQLKPELTREGLQCPFLQLEDNSKANLEAWKSLQGFYWTIKTAKQKPGATAYAGFPGSRSPGTNVFLAGQKLGSGKVFFVSSDEVWRWRYRKENDYFYRFFGQLIRWLGPERASAESKYVKLTTDKKKYVAGERVLVNAKIVDKDYNMIKEESVTINYESEGGAKERLKLSRISPDASVYTGEFIATKSGDNEVTIDYPPLAAELKNLKAGFTVEIPNLEFEAPELNETLLKKISGITGGRYFTPETAGQIPEALVAAKPKVTVRTEKDLKDSPLVVLVFAALLGLEWFLRKQKNMM